MIDAFGDFASSLVSYESTLWVSVLWEFFKIKRCILHFFVEEPNHFPKASSISLTRGSDFGRSWLVFLSFFLQVTRLLHQFFQSFQGWTQKSGFLQHILNCQLRFKINIIHQRSSETFELWSCAWLTLLELLHQLLIKVLFEKADIRLVNVTMCLAQTFDLSFMSFYTFWLKGRICIRNRLMHTLYPV